jgi:hypothetical protein
MKKQTTKLNKKTILNDMESSAINFAIDSVLTPIYFPFPLLTKDYENQGRHAHTKICAITAIATNPTSPCT